MARRPRTAIVGVSLLLAFAGCRMVPERLLPERRVDLPADVTAAIVAGAVRRAVPSESVADSSGAPAARQRDGGYRVELAGDGRGRWLWVADRRLRIRLGRHSNRAHVDTEVLPAASSMRGFGWQSREQILFSVVPDGHGSRVTIDLPSELEGELAPQVLRALDLAESIDLAGPGITEPNLATWRLARLLQAAAATADPAGRARLLQRAIRLPNAPAHAHGELAVIASASGEHNRALRHLRLAACVSNDPRERAHYAGRVLDLHENRTNPDRMRERAFVLLVNDRLDTAMQMVHGASRMQRQPVVDFRLLGQIHRRKGDDEAALAAELLAREYAADAAAGGPHVASADALIGLPATGPPPARPPGGR